MQAEDLLGLLSRKGCYTEWFKRLPNTWMKYCSVVCFRKSLMIFLHDPTLLLPTSLRGFFSFANYEIIEPCNPTGKGPERERERERAHLHFWPRASTTLHALVGSNTAAIKTTALWFHVITFFSLAKLQGALAMIDLKTK